MRSNLLVLLVGLAVGPTAATVRPAAAQSPAAGPPSAEQIAAWAEPCPAADARHRESVDRLIGAEVPDSLLGQTARGLAAVLRACGDPRVLAWFQDEVRAEAGMRRAIAGALLGTIESVELPAPLRFEQAAFLTELVRQGYAKGRDETEPSPGRDLQSYVLEGLKRTAEDAELSKLYFEWVGTGTLDPVFGEGRLLGHLVARRDDAFLGEYADVFVERPQLVRDGDVLFYANQVLYGRELTPGSGAEKLASALRKLGAPLAR